MKAAFDEYAGRYDAAINEGLSLSGESKDYFAKARVRWMAGRLRERGVAPQQVLDFGCGTGDTCPELLHELNAQLVVGVDPSFDSILTARQTHTDPRLRFEQTGALHPSGRFQVAYCNGVFHHIESEDRPEALRYLRRSLADGGFFGFCENNPWNPGTRLVMRRIPFDRDAQLLSAPAARALLTRAGFEILSTDFLFLFPRALAALRPIETRLTRVPAGAQYMILCRKVAW
jgi:ubiquinone/menaquinone biosynthesis C-methylase UbiE